MKKTIDLSFTSYFNYLCIILPIILFFYGVYEFALNVPYYDDWNFLAVSLDFRDAPSVVEKAKILFRDHNTHQIAIAKLGPILQTLWFGEINFRTLILLGSLLFLGIYLLFVRVHCLENQPLNNWAFVPLSLLFFTPVFYEDTIWYICLWQHTFNLAVTLGGLYLLSCSQRRNIFAGFILILLSVLSSGSGTYTAILGIFVLGFNKKWGLLVCYIVACMVLYFVFQKQSGTASNDSYQNYPSLFVSFLGMPAYYLRGNLNDTLYAGVVVFVVAVIEFIRFLRSYSSNSYLRKHLVLLAFFGYVFIIALGAAVKRGSSNAHFMVSEHYQVYPAVGFMICYLVALSWLSKPIQHRIFIGLSIVFSLLFYVRAHLNALPQVINYHNLLKANISAGKKYGTFLSRDAYLNTQKVERNQEGIRQGIYRFPKIELEQLIEQGTLKAKFLKVNLTVSTAKDYMYIRSSGLQSNPQIRKRASIFLVLKSKTNTYLFPVTQEISGRLSYLLQYGSFTKPDFDTYIFEHNTIRDYYEVSLIDAVGSDYRYYSTSYGVFTK